MPLLHAIVLGIVQGLSEFLPISSSGHLEVVPWLLGWDDFAGDPELETTFDVALHLGTFVGAVAYFRSDLLRLAAAGVQALRPSSERAEDVAVETAVTPAPGPPPDAESPAPVPGRRAVPDDGRLAWLLLASALPAAVTGLLLGDVVAEIGEVHWLIGVLLAGFGLLLLAADRLGGRRPADSFRLRDALGMGLAQALALGPGVSRSGVTMTAGRALGFERDAAARLSFLMSLPIIAGAGLYEGVDVVADPGRLSGFEAAFVAGMLASAVTGWLAVWGTLRIVRTRTFTPFVAYRVVVGSAIVVIALTGLR